MYRCELHLPRLHNGPDNPSTYLGDFLQRLHDLDTLFNGKIRSDNDRYDLNAATCLDPDLDNTKLLPSLILH